MKRTTLSKWIKTGITAVAFFAFIPSFGQMNKDCNPNGVDSFETLKQNSLYREDFRLKRFEDAYPSWQYVFTNAPCHKEQMLADGPEFVEYFLKQTKDPKRTKELLDTMDLIFQTRLKYFNREAYVKAKWGKAIIDLDKANSDKGIALIAEAVKLDGKEVESAPLQTYFVALLNKYNKKEISKDSLLAVYENLSRIIDFNNKNNPGTEGLFGTGGLKVENIAGNTFTAENAAIFDVGAKLTFKASLSSPTYIVTYIEDSLVTVSDTITEPEGSPIYEYKKQWKATQDNLNAYALRILGCEDIIRIKQPAFEADPTNREEIERIMLYLTNARCTNSDFYVQVAEKYVEINPDAKGFRELADAYRKKGFVSRAVEYFEKAIELEQDKDQKVKDYINIAKSYAASRNATKVREYAMKALSLDPNKGEAYILIGDAYVMVAQQCGDAFENKTVYWAAVDKYLKARQVDIGVAGAANKRIGIYSGYFPEKQEIFFRNLTENSAYTLKCWPNEVTTVRPK